MTDIDERDIWGECERLYEYGTENEYARNEVSDTLLLFKYV